MTDQECTTNLPTDGAALVTQPDCEAGNKTAQAVYKTLPYPLALVIHFIIGLNLFLLLIGLLHLIPGLMWHSMDASSYESAITDIISESGLLIVLVPAFYVKPRKVVHIVAFSIGFALVIFGCVRAFSAARMADVKLAQSQEKLAKDQAELGELLKEKATSEVPEPKTTH